WIALSYAFDGMYKMVVNYIFYAQKTYILAWITFLAAGINIILNYLLIKINGAIGAAQATTATFALQFLLTWFLSSRVYKMPWILKG
ncbi:MAG: flippase, partial [Clostridiales bacterium]|nr:flippase [Clostridiales bacterium]